MTALEIYTIINNDLELEFQSGHTIEEIDNLKNHFLNQFYNGYKNKYIHDLIMYKKANIFDSIQEFYSKEDVSDQVKLDLLKIISSSEYESSMMYVKGNILPKRIEDLKFIPSLIYNGKYKMLAYIIYCLRNDSEQVLNIVNGLEFNLLNIWNKYYILNYYNILDDEKCEGYDILFDNFCKTDFYWSSVEQFLKTDATAITASNIVSILEALNSIGVVGKKGLDSYNRFQLIGGIINNRNLEFIPNKSLLYDGGELTTDIFSKEDFTDFDIRLIKKISN